MQIQNRVHDHAMLPAERSASADGHEETVSKHPLLRAERYHLIVAFSDQMATPQTRFFGTRDDSVNTSSAPNTRIATSPFWTK